MAQRTINGAVMLRNDIAANWVTYDPVLSKGEIGIEIDTNKFKFGNGREKWSELPYAANIAAIIEVAAPTASDTGYDAGTLWMDVSADGKGYYFNGTIWKQIVTPEDLQGLGYGDMLMSVYDQDGDGIVDKAEKLDHDYTVTVSGDVAITLALALSGGNTTGTATATLPNLTGLTEGTYTKLTINKKGQVTAATNVSASDIPNLTLSKITDAGTAASKNTGTAAGNVPVLGSDGKLDTSVMPPLALTDIYEVASEAAMLALNAQQGDMAIRSDINRSFILKQAPASTLANWIELKTPTDAVLSVNGKTGAVTLTTTDIGEGTNLYYTEARATSNFNTNIANTNVSTLKDGANVLMSTDSFILDCGGRNRE